MVPAKKRTDIHLLGSARPKDDFPVPSWPMAMRVGPVAKIAMLTGPRAWNWSLLRSWHLTLPDPTPSVALHMGMAYGGAVRKPSYKGPSTDDVNNKQAFDTYPHNPAGKGYLGERWLDRAQYYPAAQIEDVKNPIRDIHKCYAPVAFGPVPRSYPARARHSGTCDARWRQDCYPSLPSDFDFAFYQSAQPDMIAPGWLEGDEPIILIGCHPQGRLDSQLPGIRVMALLTDANGHIQPETMRLDTVSIDLDNDVVQLVWRLTIPKTWQLRHALLTAIPDGPPPTGAQRPITIHRSSPVPLGAGRG